MKEITDRANKILLSLEENLPIILPQLSSLLNDMSITTQKIDQITPQGKQVLTNANQTLNQTKSTLSDISAAARSMKNLTDYLEQHPEAVLKGKKK